MANNQSGGKIIGTLSLLAVLSFTQCSKLTVVGGASEETNARVSGKIVDSCGNPAENTLVQLFPNLYNPAGDSAHNAGSFSDTTNANGEFVISDVQKGTYNLCALNLLNGTRTLSPGITVSNANNLLVPPSVLKKPGVIVVGLPDSLKAAGGFVYIPGTARYEQIDSASVARKAVVFDSVPADVAVSFLLNSPPVLKNTIILSDSLQVFPGDTVYSAKVYTRKLIFNTTASGADVSENVCNFPVLIRLTNSNFDFSKAQPNGNDIRLQKATGAPLPFEIERWDAAAQKAEIWVKLDTIYGNDSTHFITLYWGLGSAATGASNSAAVFDTANGFQGVWHMSQSQSPVLDATANHYDGTLSDTAPTATTGAIGICQQFNGMSNYIRMLGTASSRLNFPENGTYSVSAWVYVDTLDTTIQKIIEKNNLQYKLQIDQFENWSFSEYENATGYDLTNSAATAKTWVFLVGVRSGLQQYLYVNGMPVNSTIAPLSYSKNRDTTTDLAIGKSAQSSYGVFFNGKIDEARVENRDHGADWILLCYMNQRPDDRLVVFRP
jgi:hypothetical protein